MAGPPFSKKMPKMKDVARGKTSRRRFSISLVLFPLLLAGCAWGQPKPPADLTWADRPLIAILPFGLGIEISRLSSVKTVEGTLSAEDEARQLAEAVREIREEARWLFQSRLAVGRRFRFVPLDQTDAAAAELQLKPGILPTAEQAGALRNRLGADLVIVASILDYGKVRWQWLAAGMMADMTAESIVLGLATAWNPVAIFANIGFELLTSTPVWFGGGYLFGVAFRPVRAEARAIETLQGYPVWQEIEEAFYAWDGLKLLPEADRGKKESQLYINLATVAEAMADSLTEAGFTIPQLGAR